MPRPSKHDESRILNAAAALVAEKGPGAATMTAIGQAMGAPNGSIYHRFRTRDELLGRLWLNKAAMFQNRWADAVQIADAREAAVEAGLSIPRVAREDFDGASIMLLHRRQDFLSAGWPPDMQAEAERLGKHAGQMLGLMTKRLFGNASERSIQATSLALIDLPYAAVRRYVGTGQKPPPALDRLIERALLAVLDAD
jgi:AcrR family transcriptional regulator